MTRLLPSFLGLILLIPGISNAQTKEIILEWYCSANEGYTPDAVAIIEQLESKYSNVHHIGVHIKSSFEDSMSTTDGDDLLGKYSNGGIPAGMVNRRSDTEGVVIARNYWEKYIKKELATSPEVVLDITNRYDKTKRELSIDIDVEYLKQVTQSTYLTVYLVEDSVTGSGKGYDQLNFLNNSAGHRFYKAGSSIKGFPHRNVLRQNLTGLKGELLGSNIAKGSTKGYSKTISIPKRFNENRMKIVAFVSYLSSTASGNYVLNSKSAPIIAPCLAEFNHSIKGHDVDFTSNSHGYDSLKWDFGDGNNSKQANPKHSFASGGDYDVTLTIYSGGSLCSSVKKKITLPYLCAPDFDFSTNGLKVTFDNKSSGDYQTVKWDFGDGNNSSTENPVYTYSSAGTYTVELTLYDPDIDICSTQKKDITVKSTSCSTGFTYTSDKLKLTLNNTSSGDVSSRMWDFGDGDLSTKESPEHTYSMAGTYTVCLTNFDVDSDTCGQRKCEDITVDTKVGLDESKALAIAIYPNPGNGLYNVHLPEGTETAMAQVYNSVGQQVWIGALNASSQIDLSFCNSGAYYLVISGDVSGSHFLYKE